MVRIETQHAARATNYTSSDSEQSAALSSNFCARILCLYLSPKLWVLYGRSSLTNRLALALCSLRPVARCPSFADGGLVESQSSLDVIALSTEIFSLCFGCSIATFVDQPTEYSASTIRRAETCMLNLFSTNPLSSLCNIKGCFLRCLQSSSTIGGVIFGGRPPPFSGALVDPKYCRFERARVTQRSLHLTVFAICEPRYRPLSIMDCRSRCLSSSRWGAIRGRMVFYTCAC